LDGLANGHGDQNGNDNQDTDSNSNQLADRYGDPHIFGKPDHIVDSIPQPDFFSDGWLL
jgi:hypothetical protein